MSFQGAAAIGQYLLETYGPDSLAMIVDEGGTFQDHVDQSPCTHTWTTGGYADLNGVVFATPAVAEKGYMDIRMDVLTPGGHSSTPPKHTVRITVSSLPSIHRHDPIGNRYLGCPYHRTGGSSAPT